MDTPCSGSDEWTRDSNHIGLLQIEGHKTPEQKIEDYEATLRAQFICMTRCPVRRECLEKALSFGPDNDEFVWGGYTGPERARMRAGTFEFGNGRTPRGNATERLYAFLNGASLQDVTDILGNTPHGLRGSLKTYLWQLRVDAGDEAFVASFTETSDSSDSVAAA